MLHYGVSVHKPPGEKFVIFEDFLFYYFSEA